MTCVPVPEAMLTVGSLFTGIGGFDLGLERAGMRVLWQSEIDGFCQRVLARHWPGVLLVPDVQGVGAGTVPAVDVVCGGFPCQDISLAGKGAGIDGERSGLWSEMFRVVRELRPRYVLVENVPALLGRGLGRVVGDLASCGYDAEWDCLPASAFGAPHRRDRFWLVAYTETMQRPSVFGVEQNGAHAGVGDVADPEGVDRRTGAGEPAWAEPADGGWWAVEPAVDRMAHGVPARVDRLRSLGNSLVPQIAQWIGERIVAYERSRKVAA